MTFTLIPLAANTPVLVFSGTGAVRVRIAGGNGFISGDSSVTAINGANAASALEFRFTSPSEIWGFKTTAGDAEVTHWY